MRYLCWAILAFLPSLGCATTVGFTDDAFVSRDKGYSIRYAHPKSMRLVGDGWKLENYFVGNGGKPGREKTDGIYRASMDWADESGATRKVKYVIYDVRYRHGNGSSLVVCTVAVPPSMQMLSLSTVAERWANSYNGTQLSFESAEDDDGKSGKPVLKAVEGKRTASKLLGSKAREISDKPAREVTFDVVDADQLEADPEAPRTRVRAVFVEAPLYKEFLDSGGLTTSAFLLVVYTADEHKFDASVDEYESLLGRIQIPAR